MKEDNGKNPEETVEFYAGGMFCDSCEKIIQRQVQKIDGVKSADISYFDGKGSVTFYTSKTNIEKLSCSDAGSMPNTYFFSGLPLTTDLN